MFKNIIALGKSLKFSLENLLCHGFCFNSIAFYNCWFCLQVNKTFHSASISTNTQSTLFIYVLIKCKFKRKYKHNKYSAPFYDLVSEEKKFCNN